MIHMFILLATRINHQVILITKELAQEFMQHTSYQENGTLGFIIQAVLTAISNIQINDIYLVCLHDETIISLSVLQRKNREFP